VQKIDKGMVRNPKKGGQEMADCVVADDPVHVVGTGGHTHSYDIPEDPRERSF
jgi:hypothetical protein